MFSIQITKPGEIRLINNPIPDLGKTDVLIKIKYVGFCGSDLSSYQGRNPLVNYPVVPGHEVAGTIEKKGNDVPGHLSAGQEVTVIPYTSCGECPSCRRGRTNACQFNQTLGVQRDGAMSEYIAVPWQKVLVVNGLSMKQLAMTEPLTVGFHAASRGRVKQEDAVAVLGCGIIGVGAIISSVKNGATVIAVDVDDNKLKLAKELGAKYTINSSKENLLIKLKEFTNDEGPDVVIEAAGQTATYQTAISSVAFTGRVVCIGYAKEDIAFATRLFVQKEIDIMGSRNAAPEDFKSVTEYLTTNQLPVSKLLSMIIKPRDTPAAMMRWAANPGAVFKVLVDFE